MINLEQIIRQLAGSAGVIRALVEATSDEQAQWQPGPDAWSIAQVMEHLYNEERIDFRQHLQEMFSDPPQPWGALRREGFISVENCRQALELFLSERQASIAWLKALKAPDWDIRSKITFGPDNETMTLSAGDVLVSWVDHDLLHLRQMIRVLHGRLEQETAPYSGEYAGGQW